MLRIRPLPLSLLGLLWLALLLPPTRAVLERTMSAHMLVHIPALVLIGWGAATRLAERSPALLGALQPYRWALLVSAFTTMGLWMIPRLLDMATESLPVDVIKALTLSLAGGTALCWGWRNTGPVIHGLIHVEALASLLRLGWIYLESPTRLCTSYGLSDQYWLGNALLILGGCYAAWMAWQALLGTPRPLALTTR
jgi:hypothetical protein